MNQPKYQTFALDDFVYAFISEGPKGKIQKGIVYTNISDNTYNLAFGDWNKETQVIDDKSRSNNGDMDKILATVALTALEFLNRFPEARLFFEGSTAARTRLYQIGICRNLLEITEKIKIMGLFNDHWEGFETGRNYESFAIMRK